MEQLDVVVAVEMPVSREDVDKQEARKSKTKKGGKKAELSNRNYEDI